MWCLGCRDSISNDDVCCYLRWRCLMFRGFLLVVDDEVIIGGVEVLLLLIRLGLGVEEFVVVEVVLILFVWIMVGNVLFMIF